MGSEAGNHRPVSGAALAAFSLQTINPTAAGAKMAVLQNGSGFFNAGLQFTRTVKLLVGRNYSSASSSTASSSRFFLRLPITSTSTD